jgi:hypothetical protein
MVSEKYKRLESRKSHRKLSNNERSVIQKEINTLQSGIQQYVNAYKQANPDKQTPELTATTNNTNMISSKSANPTQRTLSESIPTSRTLSNKNKQKTQSKSRNTSKNTHAKLVKH